MDFIQNLLPHIQVIKKLGSNALGILYQIRHPEYGECCCKLFIPEKISSKPNPERKKLLLRCLSGLTKLRVTTNPYLAKVLNYDEINGQYLIREFVNGINLEQYIQRQTQLELTTVAHLIEKILLGMQTLHAFGLIYKNLKPNNIIISDDRLQLLDYSLPPTMPYCLSPEQCAGKKSEIVSDIYALGTVYYFCLTKHYPFEFRLHKEIMQAHKEKICPDITTLRNDISAPLATLLNQMLSKNPEERPENCEAVLQRLQEIGVLSYPNLGIPLEQAQDSNADEIHFDMPNLPTPVITPNQFNTPELIMPPQLTTESTPTQPTPAPIQPATESTPTQPTPAPIQPATELSPTQPTTENLDITVSPTTTPTEENPLQKILASNLLSSSVDEFSSAPTVLIRPSPKQIDTDYTATAKITITPEIMALATEVTKGSNSNQLVSLNKSGISPQSPIPIDDTSNSDKAALHNNSHNAPSITPISISDEEIQSAQINTDPNLAVVSPQSQENQTQDKIAKLKQVTSDMTNRLKVVNQTLDMLEEAQGSQGLEAILFIEEMLRFITSKIGELLNAERTIIFLVDEERNELLPIMDKTEPFSLMEFRIPSNEGLVGIAISTKQTINIHYDCYNDAVGHIQTKLDEQMHYRTYTTLCLPIVNRDQTIAVLQLLNKVFPNVSEDIPLRQRVDPQGFLESDEELFRTFITSLRVMLDSSRAFYRATQRMRAANSLMTSIQTLSHSSLDLNESLRKVMDEARRLIDADRMTIWLLDEEKNELWANIPTRDGSIQERRIPKTAGFAGKVVSSQEPLLIPFDLYSLPDSETAKAMDRSNEYRTCSLMCLPIFNLAHQLIGVTQLVNKRRKGEFPPYNHQDWPKAPDVWKTSFSKSDMQFIQTFNIQAGVTIQNATMFAKIKQQEQMQRDILRSLANGVISVDKNGKIITANESARRILNIVAGENLQRRDVRDLICIKEQNFGEWLNLALGRDNQGNIIPAKETLRPDVILTFGEDKEGRSINISLHSITDTQDNTAICGALVVMEDLSKEKRIRGMMCRYMSDRIVDQLLASHDIQLGGQLKDVTVLFSDIRSYTTITEGMRAEEVVAMLNEYFEAMVSAVFDYQGTLDKYIGDALMAVFGSPLPLPDHAWYAVRCALKMREQLAKFNERRIAQGKQAIKIGMGIHSDIVVSGNIGCSKRMEFTSIGDGVNLASRLESITKQYGCDLVISEETYKRCSAKIHVRELDLIVVKGKTQAVKIYEVIGLAESPLSPAHQQRIELYQQARILYRNRRFVEALEIFNKLLQENPKDSSVVLHQERCLHFIATPPEENWDGVWKFNSK